MSRWSLSAAIGLILIAVSLAPIARPAAAAMDVQVGDYWKYDGGADLEGMTVSVKSQMKITGTEGTGASEVYVISVTGSGEMSGSTGSITISGDVEMTGKITRLKSNFSLVSNRFDMSMSATASGMTMTMTMGVTQSFSPALDDYIGDNNPGHGGSMVSRSTVTTTTTFTMTMSGMPTQTDTDTSTEQVEMTTRRAFECYRECPRWDFRVLQAHADHDHRGRAEFRDVLLLRQGGQPRQARGGLRDHGVLG